MYAGPRDHVTRSFRAPMRGVSSACWMRSIGRSRRMLPRRRRSSDDLGPEGNDLSISSGKPAVLGSCHASECQAVAL